MKCFRALLILFCLCLFYGCTEHSDEDKAAEKPKEDGQTGERFAKATAQLELNKEEYVAGEAIFATLKIAENESWQRKKVANWWLYSPECIRIQDENEKDVALLVYPLCEPDQYIRSKIFRAFSSKTIDLTSFVEPNFGVEYVFRFTPGKYTATFYFTFEYLHERDGFGYYDMAHPKVWGRFASNSVTFAVRKATKKHDRDIRELLKKAEQAVTKNKADESVAIYKEIILGCGEQTQIQAAIQQIRLIRRCRSYDYEILRKIPTITENQPLAAQIRALLEKQGGFLPEKTSLRLSLLHVPESERITWCRRYARNMLPREKSKYASIEEEAAEDQLFHDLGFEELFHFPQFNRAWLESAKTPGQ